jgi:hypothetical protein
MKTSIVIAVGFCAIALPALANTVQGQVDDFHVGQNATQVHINGWGWYGVQPKQGDSQFAIVQKLIQAQAMAASFGFQATLVTTSGTVSCDVNVCGSTTVPEIADFSFSYPTVK